MDERILAKLGPLLPKDVTIRCGEAVNEANKALLRAYSDKFAAIVEDDSKSNYILHDVEINPVFFHAIIQFIHERDVELENIDVVGLFNAALLCEVHSLCIFILLNIIEYDIIFQGIQYLNVCDVPIEPVLLYLASKIEEIFAWDGIYDQDVKDIASVLSYVRYDLIKDKNLITKFFINAIAKWKEESIILLKHLDFTCLPDEQIFEIENAALDNNILQSFSNQNLSFYKYTTTLKSLNTLIEKYNSQTEQLNEITILKQENQTLQSDIAIQKAKLNQKTVEIKPDGPLISFSVLQAKKESIIKANQPGLKNVDMVVLLLGAPNTGKTSLIYKFLADVCPNDKIEQLNQNMHYKYQYESGQILNIIDIPADPKPDNLKILTYAIRAQCIILVCSPDQKESIKYAREVYKNVCQVKRLNAVPAILCMNKTDSSIPEMEKYFTLEEAINAKNQMGISLMETSALTGVNVQELFDGAVDSYYHRSLTKKYKLIPKK